MKKVFVLSGALVFVSGGAGTANIINGNPMYGPAKGRFYNLFTPVQANSEFNRFVMADEFG